MRGVVLDQMGSVRGVGSRLSERVRVRPDRLSEREVPLYIDRYAVGFNRPGIAL